MCRNAASSFESLNPLYSSLISLSLSDTRALRSVGLFVSSDQLVLPVALTAYVDAEQFRPAIIKLTIEFPGEAHTAMGLNVFLPRRALPPGSHLPAR